MKEGSKATCDDSRCRARAHPADQRHRLDRKFHCGADARGKADHARADAVHSSTISRTEHRNLSCLDAKQTAAPILSRPSSKYISKCNHAACTTTAATPRIRPRADRDRG